MNSFVSLGIFCVFIIVLVSLVNVSGSPILEENKIATRMTNWEQCETSLDCGVDECCVSLHKSDVRVCKKKPDLGNYCRPVLLPGINYSCPCSTGLTCALTALDNYGKHEKYQCVLVPEEEQEYESSEYV